MLCFRGYELLYTTYKKRSVFLCTYANEKSKIFFNDYINKKRIKNVYQCGSINQSARDQMCDHECL